MIYFSSKIYIGLVLSKRIDYNIYVSHTHNIYGEILMDAKIRKKEINLLTIGTGIIFFGAWMLIKLAISVLSIIPDINKTYSTAEIIIAVLFILVIAALALVLAILGKYLFVALLGLASLGMFFIEKNSVTTNLGKEIDALARSMITNDAGYYCLLIGSAALIVSAVLGLAGARNK